MFVRKPHSLILTINEIATTWNVVYQTTWSEFYVSGVVYVEVVWWKYRTFRFKCRQYVWKLQERKAFELERLVARTAFKIFKCTIIKNRFVENFRDPPEQRHLKALLTQVRHNAISSWRSQFPSRQFLIMTLKATLLMCTMVNFHLNTHTWQNMIESYSLLRSPTRYS